VVASATRTETDHLTEIEAEQVYFDDAREHRERMRELTERAPESAGHVGAAVGIRKQADAELRRMAPPGEAAAFGRIDHDNGDVFYIGKDAVFGDRSEVLVVNWQAPVAEPYYKASPVDPQGVVRKRQFHVEGLRIEDFEDVRFADLLDAVEELELRTAPVLSDKLLLDLARSRTGELQDIVQTIQAAQYDLIRQPIDQLLVIQGGPGTGKTVVGLHRVSWLLFNHAADLAPTDVLVVGPSRVFTRYIQSVLPSLGDGNVSQVDVHSLAPPVTGGREEPTETARLKGEWRMAEVLRRALHGRVGLAGDEPIVLNFGSLTARLEPAWVAARVEELRELAYAEGRHAFRERVIREARDQTRLDESTIRQGQLDATVDRIWPQFTPATFLQSLYASRDRLLVAAGDDFTAREVSLLQRRATERITDETWSDADLALLDEADHLINGPAKTRRYAHIVIDEAQDLSPMQLRAIRRRSSTGSMTVLGDIAQSTGAWARDSWSDVIEHLRSEAPDQVVNLRFGYRVPRQVFDVAATLLPHAAPDVEPPVVVRDGEEPSFLEVGQSPADMVTTSVRAVSEQAGRGRSVGLIVPDAHRELAIAALRSHGMTFADVADGRLGSAINVVSPTECKGLEFDAVVVVDPVAIVAEAERGHRMLYVALTRATTSLTVVHATEPAIPTGVEASPDLRHGAREIPVDNPPGSAATPPGPERDPFNPLVHAVASSLARNIVEAVNPALWPEVLRALEAELGAEPDAARS
jgi:DNA helicase IV